MTEISNPKYNFKEHIINLSSNDEFDDALKEWIKLPELYKKLQYGSCQCICQRQIKNFYYLYNKITHKYINVGTECYKKFNFTITKKKINKLLQDILNKYAKGEYSNIDDLDEYSTNIQLIIVQDLTDMYRKCNSNLTMLYILKENVEELINDYNFTCLEELKNLVIETINDIERKKSESEKEHIKQLKIEEDEKIQILEEERKLDEEEARKRKEYETEKLLVQTQFEEGYYINIKKNDKDKYKEEILLDYLKYKNNIYIKDFIDIYKDNLYLYNKIKIILDKKLNAIEKIKKEEEVKKYNELQIEKSRINQEIEEIKAINIKKLKESESLEQEYKANESIIQKESEIIKSLLYEKKNLLYQINTIESNISDLKKHELDITFKNNILSNNILEVNKILKEQSRIIDIQNINDKIILYNKNIDKWKLMTQQKEKDETDDDYNNRIIYTKNGPLKIKDILILNDFNIDKNIEKKIRDFLNIEDINENYLDIGKPWLINSIDYKEIIQFDINTIYYLSMKFYILNTKTLQYLKANYKELEFYIRYKLNQRVFPDSNYHFQNHLRFDFDEQIDFESQDDKYYKTSNNKYILDLFNKFYNDKTVLISTHKGSCNIRYIYKNSKIIDTVDFSGLGGTVDILIGILNFIY
jgi:hypothetical protein